MNYSHLSVTIARPAASDRRLTCLRTALSVRLRRLRRLRRRGRFRLHSLVRSRVRLGGAAAPRGGLLAAALGRLLQLARALTGAVIGVVEARALEMNRHRAEHALHGRRTGLATRHRIVAHAL